MTETKTKKFYDKKTKKYYTRKVKKEKEVVVRKISFFEKIKKLILGIFK